MADAIDIRIIQGDVVGQGAVVIRQDAFEPITLADRAVAAAAAQAEEILARARQDAEHARLQGYAEGYAQGTQEAAKLALAVRQEAVQMRSRAGDRLVRLGVDLARRVIGQELTLSPEVIVGLARRALSEVSWCRRAVLRLHPEDARSLQLACPNLASLLDNGAELTLLADDRLGRGACLVETASGEVDGSVELQLAALEQALLGEPSPGENDG